MGNQLSYEDYPDGEHCLYKTGVVTRQTTILALFLASLDVVNFSKPTTIGGALARFPQYMVPGVFTGVAFGLTTCTLAMIRQKEDNWNYLFGGAAAGSVFGMARRSFAVGTPCAIVFGIAGVAYREYRNTEAYNMKPIRNENGTWDSMTFDWTLTPENPPPI